MKITYSKENINSFGGINFADHIIDNTKAYEQVDKELGSRHNRASYKYSDLLRSYFLLTLCGGECAEDINENLRGELEQVKSFSPSSPDTLLRMMLELSTEKETHVSDTDIEHDFNINLKMNKLMLNMLLLNKQLESGDHGYILDYDNQFIPTEKYDSKKSYKKANGYFPGIVSIGNFPVYIENRNGNSNVKYLQDETLTRMFDLLAGAGVKIEYARMDCGSFSKDIIAAVEPNCKYFMIRAQRCESLYGKIKEVEHWEDVEIGFKKYQVASIEYKPFGGNKAYRYVVSREKKPDAQGDLFTGDDFKYRAIITNNHEMSDLEVVLFYNARGESERLFDEMNNDFLWKKMPFSFLEQNTVFLVLMAICRNLFHFLTEYVSKRIDFIKPSYRLKKFIFRFVVVPAKWITRGRQSRLKLFTDKQYHLLFQ